MVFLEMSDGYKTIFCSRNYKLRFLRHFDHTKDDAFVFARATLLVILKSNTLLDKVHRSKIVSANVQNFRKLRYCGLLRNTFGMKYLKIWHAG
jgi:hypothetical protein